VRSTESPDRVLELHVVPGAKHTGFDGTHDERVRVRLAAPPVDGAANRELIRFLAKAFGVRRTAVTLEAGAASRRKRVRIAAPTRDPLAPGT
jgi:uncharacterized protein (TIGR00251 family)